MIIRSAAMICYGEMPRWHRQGKFHHEEKFGLSIQLIEHKKRWFDRDFEFSKRYANQFQRIAYSDGELLTSITNSLKMHSHSIQWDRSFFGRIAGSLGLRTDPDNLVLEGMKLSQIYELAQVKPPSKIAISRQYKINIRLLQSMLSKAKVRVEDHHGEDSGRLGQRHFLKDNPDC